MVAHEFQIYVVNSLEREFTACLFLKMRLTLATKFMDKLGLPEEHDMLLVLRCFFLKTETKTQVSDFDQTNISSAAQVGERERCHAL